MGGGEGALRPVRGEGRLRAALALYKSRASRSFVRQLNRGVILALWDGISLGELIEEVKALRKYLRYRATELDPGRRHAVSRQNGTSLNVSSVKAIVAKYVKKAGIRKRVSAGGNIQ